MEGGQAEIAVCETAHHSPFWVQPLETSVFRNSIRDAYTAALFGGGCTTFSGLFKIRPLLRAVMAMFCFCELLPR